MLFHTKTDRQTQGQRLRRLKKEPEGGGNALCTGEWMVVEVVAHVQEGDGGIDVTATDMTQSIDQSHQDGSYRDGTLHT